MYFASSVAVAVAPGTPGMGNVTTGLPASHDRVVLPAASTPSFKQGAWVGAQLGCFRSPCDRGLGRALGTGPQADEPLRHGARHRGGLPFPLNDLRTRYVFVPGVLPADNLDVRIRLSVGPGAGVLNPLTRRLVVGAHTIFRERAGLSVHLDGALPLIFERDDQLVLVNAPQHAHVPGPVEKHCPQVLGTGRGSVRWRGLAVRARRLGTGRRQRADCENDP